MARSKDATREAILEAAEAVIREKGAHAMTMDAVARGAGCAKGLVHYHFKTKQRLMMESVRRIAAAREAAWISALDTPDPQSAIDETWDLLKQEADSGTLKAWTSLTALPDKEVDQEVNEASARFRAGITAATTGLLRRTGLKTTIHEEQLGWLLAAIVQGMVFQLAAGADAHVLENAYAAAWLGLLSLTEPAGQ
jgi:AcrR family transcriptional regulator